MGNAIADLLIIYIGFLFAWWPVVSATEEGVRRRCGRDVAADMSRILAPVVGLIFLITPLAGRALAAPGVPALPLAALAVTLGAWGLYRLARRLILQRHGPDTWHALRCLTARLALGLAILSAVIHSQVLGGAAMLTVWAGIQHNRAKAAMQAREEAARQQAQRTHDLRQNIGTENSPFRR